ncbi:MAG: uracil-DNA glycosylase [Rickettsiales bacterium]
MFTPPPPNCPLCPRLVAFRQANAGLFPHFFNGAVPSFGGLEAELLVVGLAPGLKGANATGRPFTGDYAGEVLYSALAKYDLAEGSYERRADDGFHLLNVRITNAVRCVPPENKPTPLEEKTCNPFLIDELAAMPNLKIILSLGLTSHNAVLRTLKLKAKDFKFAHGAVHQVGARGSGFGTRERNNEPRATSHEPLLLLDSYHTSRYNISTGRLTQDMFDAVVARAKALLGH